MTEKQEASMGKVVAKAWADPAFKAALLADPDEALKAAGIRVPQGIELRVVEDSPTCRTLVLPPAPHELSEADMEGVAGGWQATISIDKIAL